MTISSLIAALLIGTGTIIMLINILKFRTLPNLIKDFSFDKQTSLSRFFYIRLGLMIFFFFGYIIVLYSYMRSIHLVGAIFVGTIFLFGAIFVLHGILLQFSMLKRIKNHYNKVAKVSSELEDKHLESKQEIEDRKQVETALRASEAFNSALFKFNPVETIVVDQTGKIIKYNQAKQTSGDRIPDIGGIMYKDYADKHNLDMYAELMDCIRTGKIKIFDELSYGDKYLKITMASFPQGAIITTQDITDTKNAMRQIEKSLKEKEILLQEIHHRVKNNMQIISSLLSIQSFHVKEPDVKDVFRACQNRINSMALIHETLYKSKDLGNIDYNDYITRLVKQLTSAYDKFSSKVKTQVDAKNITLDINRAIPCGLIISELVTNSLKHAFPDDSAGIISVSLHLDRSKKFVLIIKDNGIGLPKEFDLHKTDTLGLQLVVDLTAQLEGTIDLNQAKGTEFIIKFF